MTHETIHMEYSQSPVLVAHLHSLEARNFTSCLHPIIICRFQEEAGYALLLLTVLGVWPPTDRAFQTCMTAALSVALRSALDLPFQQPCFHSCGTKYSMLETLLLLTRSKAAAAARNTIDVTLRHDDRL